MTRPIESPLADQRARESMVPFPGYLRDTSGQAVSPQAVHRQLNKIIASTIFTRSKQLCRFLRFVVEETTNGNADGVKESLIGTMVFKRGELFNPGIDPIVRVQARRLRRKLEEYYETEGQQDPLVIGLRTGSYSPFFVTRTNAVVQPSPGPCPAVAITEIQQSIAECERVLNMNQDGAPFPYNGLGHTGDAAALARINDILLRVLDLTRRVAEIPAVQAAVAEAGPWHLASGSPRKGPVHAPHAFGRQHIG